MFELVYIRQILAERCYEIFCMEAVRTIEIYFVVIVK